jgi:phospholipid-binding lipoprotein MlaA
VDAVKRGVAILGIVVFLSPAVAVRADQPAPAVPAGPSDSSSRTDSEPDPLFDDDFDDDEAAHGDPLEETNRDVLVGNGFIDKYLFDPVTLVYGKVVPGPLKKGIRNVFSNFDSPKIVVNDLLQLEWKDAGVATTRVVLNSTLGIGGLFDVAARAGFAKHKSDFGQTLAMAGTPSGPYLVLPLFGPSNVRDAFGGAVDVGMSPMTYILGPAVFISYGGGMGLVKREENIQALNALESSSIDFYSTLRSAYQQHREEAIWGRREDRRGSAAGQD